MKWDLSFLGFLLIQLFPVLFAVMAGKSWFAIATVFWGLGNIFAYLGSK